MGEEFFFFRSKMIHLTLASFCFVLHLLTAISPLNPTHLFQVGARADVTIMGTYCIIIQTKIKVRNGGERMRGRQKVLRWRFVHTKTF